MSNIHQMEAEVEQLRLGIKGVLYDAPVEMREQYETEYARLTTIFSELDEMGSLAFALAVAEYGLNMEKAK